MRRGKEDRKIMGPMFPRLHVNDADKGGPRAPPRNKMALYEQFSIPSQRFNPSSIPLNPKNIHNRVPSPSLCQANDLDDRRMQVPLHPPPSKPLGCQPEWLQAPHANAVNLDTLRAQTEQRTKAGYEEDFMVPIYVHQGMGESHNKSQNNKDSLGESHNKSQNNGHMARVSLLSPSLSNQLLKRQSTHDNDQRQATSGLTLGAEVISPSEGIPSETVSILCTVKPVTNHSGSRNFVRSQKEANTSPDLQHQAHSGTSFGRLQDNDISLQQRLNVGSRLESTGNSKSTGSNNDNECLEDKACGSPQCVDENRSDDVSETSMVDSILTSDISPDDVVGIIGQKHFWKARRAIVNQQRLFAVQVFELHRLVKVQSLIASSPHILMDENAYLGKGLPESPPAKKLLTEYVVKSVQPTLVKSVDNPEKMSPNIKCPTEDTAVRKTLFSSIKTGCQPSNCGPHLGSSPPALVPDTTQMSPWCLNQQPGQQWLVPVMSPSEGLIYKPYPVPGFMGPPPMMGNFFNMPYGAQASNHLHQGIGLLPGASPVGPCYFPPYGMPVLNLASSGSAVDQANLLDRPSANGQRDQLLGEPVHHNSQQQSSCNLGSEKNRAISCVKLQASKDSEYLVSTASSASETAAEGTTARNITEARDVAFFPVTRPVVPGGGPQGQDNSEQPTQVIRVVPHNRQLATESAARIFQTIQEERKQYDSA